MPSAIRVATAVGAPRLALAARPRILHARFGGEEVGPRCEKMPSQGMHRRCGRKTGTQREASLEWNAPL